MPKESRLIQEAVDQVRRRAIRRRSEGSAVPPVAGTRSDRFYLPQLDGLRFVAFFAVFVCHFPISSKWSRVPWVSAIADAGAYGVDLFFCLSSFLITALLLQEQAREGRARIGAFWIRRALRIWPLYFVVVAIAVVITPPPGWYTRSLLTFTTNWPCSISRTIRPSTSCGVWHSRNSSMSRGHCSLCSWPDAGSPWWRRL